MAKLDQYHREIADLAFTLANNDLSGVRSAVMSALRQLSRHPNNGGYTFRKVQRWVEKKIKKMTRSDAKEAPWVTPAMLHDAQHRENVAKEVLGKDY